MKYETTPEALALKAELFEEAIEAKVFQAGEQLHVFIESASDLRHLPARFAKLEVVPRITGGPYGGIRPRAEENGRAVSR